MSAGVSTGGGFAAIGGGAAPFLPAPVNLHDLASSQLVTSCMRQVQSRRRKSISANFMDAHYEGPNREGALFCRTGAWMEILDEPAADDYVRRGVMKKHSLITGTRRENSPFSKLPPLLFSAPSSISLLPARQSRCVLCLFLLQSFVGPIFARSINLVCYCRIACVVWGLFFARKRKPRQVFAAA